ncbi:MULTISPECIES: helix-turn-helix domain-containing protein [Mycobacterium]|uniref:DNA binding, excisionase family domain protein n=1 Tax=Mycobacterium intracellulare 1956 TaxID=1299331 RepID=X8CJF8_MYCIT|nr:MULTISPECIES: helix-turn-helix domain-containing protein [Mycobacterium]EUA31993.1 DNA binding, excisionase family domain protein [Mycobacterium intracellulare]EUA55390.1 DNA binding, excisionase family domain protein [Mycobacterium intracellulare 1956]UQB90885.1 helix-turn-helix domain-containing protein [Mycobacterium intracellulare]WSE48424.1 helix-turn-helix domain-containing protein [Mycobacterium sp. 3-98]
METTTTKPREIFLNGNQAAEYLGVTRRTIGNMVSDGRLRAYRIRGGRDLRIRRSDLDNVLIPVDAAAID